MIACVFESTLPRRVKVLITRTSETARVTATMQPNESWNFRDSGRSLKREIMFSVLMSIFVCPSGGAAFRTD